MIARCTQSAKKPRTPIHKPSPWDIDTLTGRRRPSHWAEPGVSGINAKPYSWIEQRRLLLTLETNPTFRREFLQLIGLGDCR